MRPIRAGIFLCACAWMGLAGCTVGELKIVPMDVETASVPDSATKNAHAVYIYDVGYLHYDPLDIGNSYFPTYAQSRYSKIKLLTRAATERYYGNIFIEHLGDLYEIKARVIKPDGIKTELQPGDFIKTVLVKDAIKGVTPPIDYNQTAIIFPGLQPGDIIEYNYTRRGRDMNWSFNHVDAPTLYSKFMAARPIQRSEIQPVLYRAEDLDLITTTEKGMATGMAGYVGLSRQATFDVWIAQNVPPVTFELANPPMPDLASRLFVWQTDRRLEWSTVGGAYHKWFSHYGRPPSRAKELATEVVAGVSDPRERARVIHDWVKKNLNILDHAQLTYVPREIEIETVDVDKLLEEKNATPEESANLMWLMMSAVGIEPTIVLTTHNETPPVIEELADTSQFNFPLLQLPDGTLIDTTTRLCPFGMVPWAFEGRRSLFLKTGSTSLDGLPISAPRDNHREVKVTGELNDEGNVTVKATISMTGQMAFAWRKWLVPKQAKEKEDGIRSIAMAAAEKAELDDFNIQNLEEPSKPLVVDLSFHVNGFAQVLKDQMIVKVSPWIGLLGCPILTDRSNLDLYVCPSPISETRKNPVEFPFKRLDELDSNVTFPLGYYLKALPKGIRTRVLDKGTSVGVQTSYASENNAGKTMQVVRKLSINELLIGVKSYPSLRDLLRAYLAHNDNLLTLELPKVE